MKKPLRILIVEDSEIDVELLLINLRRGDYSPTYQVVETPGAMRSALESQEWDVITSDHSMPNFNAPAALALAQALRPNIPFIIVSGEIDLNLAVSLIRGGAKDYIQKRELIRLVPTLERELREVEQRRERERTERALQASETRFQEVLENSQDASYKINVQSFSFEYLSPIFPQITGIALDEMDVHLPADFLSYIHPDDLTQTRQIITEALSQDARNSYQEEFRFRHKQGHYLWLLNKFNVIRNSQGQPSAFIGSVSDISERKQMEGALRASYAQTRRILDNFQDAYFQGDLSGRLTLIGPAAAVMYGYSSPDEMMGLPIVNLYADERDRGQVLAEIRKSGSIKDLTFQALRKDGTTFWVSLNAQFIRDEQGQVIGTEGAVRDISGRRQIEQALLESELKYRSLFENSTEGVFLTFPDGSIDAANPAACAMFGWSEQEIRQLGRSGLLDPTDSRLVAALAERQRTGRIHARECTAIRRNGEKFPVEVDSVILPGEPVRSFVIMRDITERKRAEEGLRFSEE